MTTIVAERFLRVSDGSQRFRALGILTLITQIMRSPSHRTDQPSIGEFLKLAVGQLVKHRWLGHPTVMPHHKREFF